MKCPYCNAEMLPGYAWVGTTWWGALVHGFLTPFSGILLRFEGEDGAEAKIVGAGGSQPAIHCPECNAMIIEGNKGLEPTPPAR